MSWESNARETGASVERLLAELSANADPGVVETAEALVGHLVGMYGEGLRRIVEALQRHGLDEVTGELAADDFVASLLILHGLHPEDTRTRVEQALERSRAYLASHGGDVRLTSLDEESSTVRLALSGTCDGCSFSQATLANTIEAAIFELAPEILNVAVEESAAPADADFIPLTPITDAARKLAPSRVTNGMRPSSQAAAS